MVDSSTVLWGQTLIYTIYVVAILLIMGWFAYRLTHEGKSVVNPKLFYSFFGFLVTLGVSLHIVTYTTIPWVPEDLHGESLAVAKTFDISVADHQFALPADVLEVPCGQRVQFNVSSKDLTYGFGVFRPDNSMVFQMQVVPWRDDNSIKWTFASNGTYTIRSTEYSGPEGAQMILPDAINVTGCEA